MFFFFAFLLLLILVAPSSSSFCTATASVSSSLASTCTSVTDSSKCYATSGCLWFSGLCAVRDCHLLDFQAQNCAQQPHCLWATSSLSCRPQCAFAADLTACNLVGGTRESCTWDFVSLACHPACHLITDKAECSSLGSTSDFCEYVENGLESGKCLPRCSRGSASESMCFLLSPTSCMWSHDAQLCLRSCSTTPSNAASCSLNLTQNFCELSHDKGEEVCAVANCGLILHEGFCRASSSCQWVAGACVSRCSSRGSCSNSNNNNNGFCAWASDKKSCNPVACKTWSSSSQRQVCIDVDSCSWTKDSQCHTSCEQMTSSAECVAAGSGRCFFDSATKQCKSNCTWFLDRDSCNKVAASTNNSVSSFCEWRAGRCHSQRCSDIKSLSQCAAAHNEGCIMLNGTNTLASSKPTCAVDCNQLGATSFESCTPTSHCFWDQQSCSCSLRCSERGIGNSECGTGCKINSVFQVCAHPYEYLPGPQCIDSLNVSLVVGLIVGGILFVGSIVLFFAWRERSKLAAEAAVVAERTRLIESNETDRRIQRYIDSIRPPDEQDEIRTNQYNTDYGTYDDDLTQSGGVAYHALDLNEENLNHLQASEYDGMTTPAGLSSLRVSSLLSNDGILPAAAAAGAAAAATATGSLNGEEGVAAMSVTSLPGEDVK